MSEVYYDNIHRNPSAMKNDLDWLDYELKNGSSGLDTVPGIQLPSLPYRLGQLKRAPSHFEYFESLPRNRRDRSLSVHLPRSDSKVKVVLWVYSFRSISWPTSFLISPFILIDILGFDFLNSRTKNGVLFSNSLYRALQKHDRENDEVRFGRRYRSIGGLRLLKLRGAGLRRFIFKPT